MVLCNSISPRKNKSAGGIETPTLSKSRLSMSSCRVVCIEPFRIQNHKAQKLNYRQVPKSELMTKPRNIAGPEIRRIRSQKRMTQPDLVAKCNLAGWNISRETLAKI